MLALSCPGCGAGFKAADIDRVSQIATCHACAQVSDLKTRSAAEDAQLDQLTRPVPAAVPLPEGFTVADGNGAFRVSWAWHRISGVVAVFIALTQFVVPAVLWNQFPGLRPVLALEVPLGLVFLYVALANLMNESSITLAQGTLSIAHGPLPWPGKGTWSRSDLAQLYAEEQRSNNGAVSYRLSAMLRDGRRVALVKRLSQKAQVVWLERTFEDRMNIVDAPVAGELKK